MSWFSILPAQLTVVETWIVRFFLLLTLLTIGPWALFLAYDLVFYALRTFHYEIPIIGGRATGARRPAKPTLEQRPDGRRRVMSMSFGDAAGVDDGNGREEIRKRRKEREEEGIGSSGADEAVGD